MPESTHTMSQPFSETHQPTFQRKVDRAAAYSARIQEVMRYDKLSSSDYPLVMTILSALSQGYTEEQWKEEQQRRIQLLLHQPAQKEISHADAANRYEQTVLSLKHLTLWPWE
ncbi:MAG TPA: hypothetical protein VKR06_10585 [Ktedonosporobacter sp.]|nr:hypothetical protein [Ktedonosporobacter sp.]